MLCLPLQKKLNYKAGLSMASINELQNKFSKQERRIENQSIQFYSNKTNSTNTLIFLPGTSGKSETYYQVISELNDSFNIIALDYPVIMKIDDLINTIEKFIDSFDFQNITLVGNSFGTILIQLLINRRPNVYRDVFMINPSTKTVNVKPEDIQSHIKSYKKQLHVLNGIFPFLYKTSYKRNIKVMVYNSSIKDKKKWYKFYIDLFNQTKREQSIAIYECLLDFWQTKNFLKSDFKGYKNTVHVLMSDINTSQSKSEFESVPKLFKSVEVYKLPDNRNLTLIKHAQLISEIISKSLYKK
jgi:pimeloyl-ACP methyl ester carboxylesterase